MRASRRAETGGGAFLTIAHHHQSKNHQPQLVTSAPGAACNAAACCWERQHGISRCILVPLSRTKTACACLCTQACTWAVLRPCGCCRAWAMRSARHRSSPWTAAWAWHGWCCGWWLGGRSPTGGWDHMLWGDSGALQAMARCGFPDQQAAGCGVAHASDTHRVWGLPGRSAALLVLHHLHASRACGEALTCAIQRAG